jgi:hypothetical protein
MFPQVLDPCYLGTVNGDGGRGEKVQASQEATGMMSHAGEDDPRKVIPWSLVPP